MSWASCSMSAFALRADVVTAVDLEDAAARRSGNRRDDLRSTPEERCGARSQSRRGTTNVSSPESENGCAICEKAGEPGRQRRRRLSASAVVNCPLRSADSQIGECRSRTAGTVATSARTFSIGIDELHREAAAPGARPNAPCVARWRPRHPTPAMWARRDVRPGPPSRTQSPSRRGLRDAADSTTPARAAAIELARSASGSATQPPPDRTSCPRAHAPSRSERAPIPRRRRQHAHSARSRRGAHESRRHPSRNPRSRDVAARDSIRRLETVDRSERPVGTGRSRATTCLAGRPLAAEDREGRAAAATRSPAPSARRVRTSRRDAANAHEPHSPQPRRARVESTRHPTLRHAHTVPHISPRRPHGRRATIPDKPALEGLESKWDAAWTEQGTYLFDRDPRRRGRPRRRSSRSTLPRRRRREPAHRPRLQLHAHRREGALRAHARQDRLLPDGLGRQRPADRAPRAELLRRALRPVAAVRPRLHAPVRGRRQQVEPRRRPGAGQPPQLHRAVRDAHRRGREALRGALARSSA